MVTPVVETVRRALDEKDVSVLEILRVDSGRYWSYACTNPDCCPEDGTPVDVSSSRVAAEATYAGLTATDSRDDLVARFAPLVGEARLAMTRATALAEARLARLVRAHPNSLPSSLLLGAGMSAVDAATSASSDGRTLTDDEVAWLSALLTNVGVRDYAWDLVGRDAAAHVALWTDVVRRASPELAAPPATLLAFAAWQAGEGAISTIALERALSANANYTMAHLLRQAIEGGMSPREYAELMKSSDGDESLHDKRPGGGSRGRGRHARRRRYARS
jgi:Domain of unknown function (DUF4192)